MNEQRRRWLLLLTERSLRTAGYWMIGVAGIMTLVWTPRTIQDQLGPVMVYIWAILLVVGGLTAAIASTMERWLIEMPAIPLVLTGLGLYLVALWAITINGEITRITQTMLVTAYAVHLSARGAHLQALARALND